MPGFTKANRKVQKCAEALGIPKSQACQYDLQAGWCCPGADICLSYAMWNGISARIKDGPETRFRCFAASAEVAFPNVRESRRENTKTMRRLCREDNGAALVCNELTRQLPKNTKLIRFHTSGDFFSLKYLMGWINFAILHPEIIIYGYTKSLHHLDKVEPENIPENFRITLSDGGKFDSLQTRFNLPVATVVFSEQEAAQQGLPVDDDDSHAALGRSKADSFALVVHGTQPAGSEAAQAIKLLRKEKKNAKRNVQTALEESQNRGQRGGESRI